MFLAAIVLGGPVRPRLVAIVGTVVALAVSYYTFVAPPEVLHRITNYSAGAASGRSDLWRIAADVAGDHPVVGVGAGNFQVVEPRYAVGNSNITRIDLIVDAPRVVHNTYLNLLVDFGAVGLAAFLLFAGGALACAWRAIRRFARYRLRDAELIGRGLLVGTVGMLASAVFLSAEYEKQLWLLFGVATALTRVATRAGGTSRALG
jgi:O-antigen ligase